jgi:pantothenate kinase
MVDIKGAPITFDIDKLKENVKKITLGGRFGWPGYDRLLHNPVEDAVFIESDIILLEGNYLLLNEDGWRDLSKYADFTISIKVSEDMLRSRLIDRKIKSGASAEKAAAFVDFSDMYNVRICLENTMKANLELVVDGNGKFSVNRDKRQD